MAAMLILVGAWPVLSAGCPPNPKAIECSDCIDAPPRWGHSTALLPDGMVLVIGGGEPSPMRFDPATDTFDSGPWWARQWRSMHLQVQLPSGDVVLLGSNGGIDLNTSVEVIAAATGEVREVGHLSAPVDRTNATAAVVDEDQVAVFRDSEGEVEVFDVTTGSTSRVEAWPGPRDAVQPLPDGTALLLGVPDVVQIDLTTDGLPVLQTWPGLLVGAPVGMSTALMADGTVVLAGGLLDGVPSTRTFVFDPGTGAFEERAALRDGRDHPMLLPLSGGRLLVAGCPSSASCQGGDRTDGFRSFEVSTPGLDAFEAHALFLARTGPTFTELADGRVLVLGGWGETGTDGYSGSYGVLPYGELHRP